MKTPIYTSTEHIKPNTNLRFDINVFLQSELRRILLQWEGSPHYGIVKENYLLIKGCCVGPKKRVVTRGNHSWSKHLGLPWRRSSSSSLIHPPNLGMVASRQCGRRLSSMDGSRLDNAYERKIPASHFHFVRVLWGFVPHQLAWT